MSEQNEVATTEDKELEIVVPEDAIAAEETEATEETEEVVEEETEETSDEGNSSQIEDLTRKIEQLENLVRQGREELDAGKEQTYDIPDDVKEYLTKFAEDPKGMTEKVVQKATADLRNALRVSEQQNAIDYIRNQNDFTEKMYNELLYIIDGPARNNYFNVGGERYQMKDLPPRHKAEAALQIYRESKQQGTAPTKKPKPVTTAKTKRVGKKPVKKETEMTADEFAKEHGIFE